MLSPKQLADVEDFAATLSAPQKLWLSGYFAGLAAQESQGGQGAPAQSSAPVTPARVIYFTESGNAERLAHEAMALAKPFGINATVEDAADLSVDDIVSAGNLLLIASTFGEGTPPSRCEDIFASLMAHEGSAAGLSYAVLALGDRAYKDFCAVGIALDEKLHALGAKRLHPMLKADVDFEAPASHWLGEVLPLFAKANTPAEYPSPTAPKPFAAAKAPAFASSAKIKAKLKANTTLSGARSLGDVRHIELSLSANLFYEPGDALDVYAHNDPALVAELRALSQCESAQLEARDVQTITPDALRLFAERAPKFDAPRDLGALHWIDVLSQHPTRLSAQDWQNLTRPMPPRAYSIASARAEAGDQEVHLTVAPVRYEAQGRARAGVASCFLADRVARGSMLEVRLRPNKHFRLPAHDVPIIMIGAGTGVAPFRAFLQQRLHERRAHGATGTARLFFGQRSFLQDFLYQLDWQAFRKAGVLTHFHGAFSRDAPQKIYVQHKILEHGAAVMEDIDKGAHVYVCGDAKAMAPAVKDSFARLFVAHKGLSESAAVDAVKGLERARRFVLDVY